MKQLILLTLLSTLSLAAMAQQNQPVVQGQPVLLERFDPATLQRDSLTTERKTSPSNAKIIAEPVGDQPLLELQRDSVFRDRKTGGTDEE